MTVLWSCTWIIHLHVWSWKALVGCWISHLIINVKLNLNCSLLKLAGRVIHNTSRNKVYLSFLSRNVIFPICVYRILKENGGSVFFLKYSLKFQDLIYPNFVEKNCLHKYEILPPLFPIMRNAYVHLPHHGKKFCSKKWRIDWGPLGIISLWDLS